MIALVRAIREERINRNTLPHDVLSGVVVGVVAIPLAMAFAIACELTQQGLDTAILAGRNALLRVVHAFRRGGRHVVLAGVGAEVRGVLEGSELSEHLDALDVWGDLEGALARAREIVTDEGVARARAGRGGPAGTTS